jgi:hypothetical protein
VEIGDVLFIQTSVMNGQVTGRRALLLQAKKASKVPTVPDNQNQWHLYAKWPQFTYAARSGALTGQQRYIFEPDMYDAAKYMLIGDAAVKLGHRPIPCHGNYTAQPTQPNISRYRCLHRDLVSLIAGNEGKPFVTPAPGSSGWDQVVYDLITETSKMLTVFTARAASASGKMPRGTGVLFMSARSSRYSVLNFNGDVEAVEHDAPPQVPETWPDEPNEEEGGISTIELIVEGEGNERN